MNIFKTNLNQVFINAFTIVSLLTKAIIISLKIKL